MPLLIRSHVAPSAIHGMGVFAVEPIAVGTPVWRFDARVDHVFPHDAAVLTDYPALAELVERHGCVVDDGLSVLLLGDDGRFINHSESPSLARRDAADWREFVALRDIAAGEELTCNYEEICEAVQHLGAPAYLSGLT